VVGAPRWKEITFDAEEDTDPAVAVVSTMTWVALMVVPLVVPSTRTFVPFLVALVLVALAEVELVPFRYFVDDVSSTVTF
jgi:hypothetical protein